MNIKIHCRRSSNYHASQRMINIEIGRIMKLIKRSSTLQKWLKSIYWRKSYCTLKFYLHQIQWKKVGVLRLRRNQIYHSSHTSAHSSMRHRRFFDIIEFMCRANTELQIKLLLIYFRGWVQKLFNCKGWRLYTVELIGSRAVRSILSIGSWLIKWGGAALRLYITT